KGQDWMLYHTRLEVGGPRYLLLDRIEWNDGWPEVRGHVPARSAEAPVFE
ncbi:arabinan endo-1,5-alpha-L-arabinosidase, partial [Alistipes onderdonkii]